MWKTVLIYNSTKIRNTPLWCVFYFDYVEVGGSVRARKGAWPIREYTIKKILKNRSSRDFFDFIYCVSRTHPLPPKDTPHFKSAVFCWISNTFNGSKISYSKNTEFHKSSNNLVSQVFAPFESTEAVFCLVNLYSFLLGYNNLKLYNNLRPF